MLYFCSRTDGAFQFLKKYRATCKVYKRTLAYIGCSVTVSIHHFFINLQNLDLAHKTHCMVLYSVSLRTWSCFCDVPYLVTHQCLHVVLAADDGMTLMITMTLIFSRVHNCPAVASQNSHSLHFCEKE